MYVVGDWVEGNVGNLSFGDWDKEGEISVRRGGVGEKKKRWRRRNNPRRQWILQDRSQFVEKMGAKRQMKVKVGQDAVEAAATASDGGQKISTRYKGAAEVNPPKYVLISIRGKVGADNNRGDRGSANIDRGGGSGSISVITPHCVTVTPMHSFKRFS